MTEERALLVTEIRTNPKECISFEEASILGYG
jgi:hypothetical protein